MNLNWKELFEDFKKLFSFFSKKSKSNDEKIIKRYDVIIFILFIFILIYAGNYFISVEKKIFKTPEIIYTNTPIVLKDKIFIPQLNQNLGLPMIKDKDIPVNEFFYGEIVGLKSFGTYGIIHEKTFTTFGYIYTIRYKDNNHTIRDIDCHSDELFRPDAGSLMPSVLQN